MRWLLLSMIACSGSPSPPAPRPVVVAPPPPPIDAAAPVDTDGDRIVDAQDKCPTEPETFNGHEDEDGCPDRGCVLVKQFPMCLDERIYFKQSKVVPDAMYALVLDNTAEAMKLTIPDVELVELRGFRSGNEARTASQQRAAAVHAALVQRGADASRLVIVDGGLGSPTTAANGQRRVELAIVKQRTSIDDADQIVCTPMGRYFKKLTDEERRAACH